MYVCTAPPYQFISHNHYHNHSSSYTPSSAAFLCCHCTRWQTPILVKSNCLHSSAYGWTAEDGWKKTDYFSNLFSKLQLPFLLNHSEAFSSHFTNKVRVSRIDIPHFFTTKIYKTICIYTDTLYFSSIIIDESSTL